jgi:hypothetical protein
VNFFPAEDNQQGSDIGPNLGPPSILMARHKLRLLAHRPIDCAGPKSARCAELGTDIKPRAPAFYFAEAIHLPSPFKDAAGDFGLNGADVASAIG